MTAFRNKKQPVQQLALLPGFEEDQAQFRRTRYETIAPLLATIKLPSGHYVEPCAGDGDIIEHVARASREGLTPMPAFWTAFELRESPALCDKAAMPASMDLSNYGISVFHRQDFLQWQHGDKSVSLVLTNWPWYGIAPFVEHAWDLYPNADVIGLCCSREPLDGDRPAWFSEHPPDWYLCDGRQRFGGEPSGYPHPVAWMRWPRDGRSRKRGSWEVLPPYSGPRSELHVAALPPV